MLSVEGLRVVYPDKTKAINNLSLTVKRGESIALIGENGAGKTSLLLALVGILEPIAGVIKVEGIPLDKKALSEVRRKIGLVFQNPDDQLFMPYIFDDVAFGCRNLGLAEKEVKRIVEETLEALNIGHLCSRSSLKLSGGEKRMAAIATVLSTSPDMLALDEPTAFLDPKARRALIKTLKKLPHTKIIATHDMAFAAEVCDRVVLMRNGHVAAEGSLELLHDKKTMRDCGLEEIGGGEGL